MRNFKVLLIPILSVVFLSWKNTADSQNLKAQQFYPLMPEPREYASSDGGYNASAVLSYLDETVNPCEDFYQFTCGERLKQYEQYGNPESKEEINIFDIMNNNIKGMLRDALEKKLTELEPRFIQLIKNMYATCMDLESIEKSGAEPLKNVLAHLGGCPVLLGNDWDESTFDWIDLSFQIESLGYKARSLMDFQGYVKRRKNLVKVRKIHTKLGVGLDNVGPYNFEARYTLILETAKLLGGDEDYVIPELLEILHFEETLLKKIPTWSVTLNQDIRFRIQELQQLVPQFPWLRYFKNVTKTDIDSSLAKTVNILAPRYMVEVADLVACADKRTIANYLIWKVIEGSLKYLSKDFRKQISLYLSKTTNATEEPRWKQCLEDIPQNALQSLFLREYFTQKTQEAVFEVKNYTQQSFLNILEENDWLNEGSKKSAMMKVRNTTLKANVDKELLNDTALSEIYENWTINNESYLNYALSANKWKKEDYNLLYGTRPWMFFDLKAEELKHKVQRDIITYEVAALQEPMFNKDRPQFMNFGAFGFLIGKFMDNAAGIGRKLESEQHQQQDSAEITYWAKQKCFIDQIKSYTNDPDINKNSAVYSGFNIETYEGLKAAYLAYQNWVKDHGEEEQLHDVKYSSNQMFWISAAAVSCKKITFQDLEQSESSTRSHPSPSVMFNLPLSNIAEFSKDFNCPTDSHMNGKQKCEFW